MPRTSPRARRMLRQAARRPHPDPSEQAGELDIVPFLDIVVNLMLFLLATTAAAMAVAEVDVDLAGICAGRRCPRPPPGLDLAVILTEHGITVTGREGRLAPGCRDTTSLPTPTVRGRDYRALRACAEALHAAHPHERSVTLTADPHVPYEDLVAAMDALRGPDEGPLFPRVRLSAGLR